jgi:hypothetical protein
MEGSTIEKKIEKEELKMRKKYSIFTGISRNFKF